MAMTTTAQVLLRYPRNVAQGKFSLSSGVGSLSPTHSFSVISEIIISDINL